MPYSQMRQLRRRKDTSLAQAQRAFNGELDLKTQVSWNIVYYKSLTRELFFKTACGAVKLYTARGNTPLEIPPDTCFP